MCLEAQQLLANGVDERADSSLDRCLIRHRLFHAAQHVQKSGALPLEVSEFETTRTWDVKRKSASTVERSEHVKQPEAERFNAVVSWGCQTEDFHGAKESIWGIAFDGVSFREPRNCIRVPNAQKRYLRRILRQQEVPDRPVPRRHQLKIQHLG